MKPLTATEGRLSAVCCCAVDRILQLPGASSARPQVHRYRSSWHSLAGLLCCLIALTVAQTCASAVGFCYCTHHLAGCVPFLERDPCLKTAVTFFVISLVWLSVLCSCCCQSPKALSVFLLAGLCGEAVLASYMVAFDRSVRIDEHLRVHLTRTLETACPIAGQEVSHDEGDAMRCFGPFRGRLEGCRRLDGRLAALCNRTSRRASVESAALVRDHAAACVAEVLAAIADKKQLYQTLTYCSLYLFALAHLFIAVAVCACDVRRKRLEKALGREQQLQLQQQAPQSEAVAANGQLIGATSAAAMKPLSEILVNQEAQLVGGECSIDDDDDANDAAREETVPLRTRV